MSLKVTIGESKTQSEKSFPKLMKSKLTGCIVYFTKPEYGLVVVEGESKSTFDTRADGWNMEYFTDFNESITLQND